MRFYTVPRVPTPAACRGTKEASGRHCKRLGHAPKQLEAPPLHVCFFSPSFFLCLSGLFLLGFSVPSSLCVLICRAGHQCLAMASTALLPRHALPVCMFTTYLCLVLCFVSYRSYLLDFTFSYTKSFH